MTGPKDPGARRAAVRVTVTGRVQGVFFRDSCAREARAQGVAGWVRNKADGNVEAWFEGRPQAVENLVTWCRQGPSRADVDGVDVVEEAPAGLDDFRIQ
jgi:acylphosphatase